MTYLNSAAIMIGLTTTLLSLWSIRAAPRPWTDYELFSYIWIPFCFLAVPAVWVLARDIHGSILRGWGVAPAVLIPFGRVVSGGFSQPPKHYGRQSTFGFLFFFPLLLAYLSSSSGGADPMHKALMDWFHLSSQGADIATIAIRKTIHFTFYGLAGYLAFRYVIASRTVHSLNDKWKQNPPALKVVWQMALAYVAILAAYDEIRQLFSPNRSGSAIDFMLDMAGACFFIWVWGTRYHKKVTNP